MKWLPLFLTFGCHAAPPRSSAETPAASAAVPAADASVERAPSALPQRPPEKSREARAPGKGLPGVVSDCSSEARTKHGPFEYVNDTRALRTAHGVFEQCVLTRKIDGKVQGGWTWSWPGFDPRGFGFPAIVFGWRPSSSRTTDGRLPIRVADVRALSVRYDVATERVGQSTLALSVWFTSTGEATAPNPGAIVSEAVVWLDYPKDTKPAGTRVGIAEVAGARYELWHASNHGDRGDGVGWDRYYFRGPNGHLEGTVRLDAFVAYLMNDERISPDRFVASVELGNELLGGSGTTWVEDYDVQVMSAVSRSR